MLARSRLCPLRLGLCLAVLALVVCFASAQHQPQPQSLFPRRPDYGRIGLCPYVKRLIPNSHYGDGDGHLRNLGNSGEPPSLCGNFCTSDTVCPDKQKCCPTHCGYACFDPVFIAD